jgi:hypothetical protein
MPRFLSRFVEWYRQWFTTSETRPDVGRNELCWCGSGKKYKHCHQDADIRRGTLTRHTTPGGQREMMERMNKRMEKKRERMKKK